jgi:hypothetical protein
MIRYIYILYILISCSTVSSVFIRYFLLVTWERQALCKVVTKILIEKYHIAALVRQVDAFVTLQIRKIGKYRVPRD